MDFLSQLLERIDQTGTNYSEMAYGVLGSEVVPLLTVAFYLYIGYYGLSVMMGTASASFSTIIGRVCRMLLILIVVSNWGTFNTLLYEWVTSVPENAGRAILRVSGTGVTEPTSGLSDIWHAANEVASAYVKQTSIWAMFPAFMAIVIWIAAGIFIAIALALLILSKLAMWVLLGVAPIFVGCLLFPETRKYAAGWFDQVILYAIMPLFIYSVAAFMIAATQPELGKMTAKIDASKLEMTDFSAFILLVVAGAFVLLNMQAIAAGIAGGQTMNMGGATGKVLGRTTKLSAKTGKKTGGGIKSGIQKFKDARAKRADGNQEPGAKAMAQSIKQNSTPRVA